MEAPSMFPHQQRCTQCMQMCSGNFTGAGGLLGIIAYICRQRPIVHWQRWPSGELAALHH